MNNLLVVFYKMEKVKNDGPDGSEKSTEKKVMGFCYSESTLIGDIITFDHLEHKVVSFSDNVTDKVWAKVEPIH